MNSRLRQPYDITQLSKQYTKMEPMEGEMIQVLGHGDEEVVMTSKSRTRSRSKEIKRSAGPQDPVSNIISQQKKIKVAWRFHLRRLRVKVNGLRKRLRGSVMGGLVQRTRALVFRGATFTAANLVKPTSFFFHFNQRVTAAHRRE